MPSIADYRIIQDGKFTLEVGEDIDRSFSFNLGDDVNINTQSILAFMLFPTSDRVSFNVEINGSNQLNYTLGSSGLSAIHEVIRSNLLNKGDNRIKFTVTSGRMTFADVVLWWQHVV